MTTPFEYRGVALYHGDALDVLPGLADDSIDSIVTDPPYELGFMGRAWDGSGIAYSVDLWKQCARVLKPGGHLLAFGGSRTWHRLTCAIEDAGFEIRDTISWLYGSGFPKSLDVSKAIDKAAGAEREVVGERNPRCGFYPNACEGHSDAGKSQSGPTYHRDSVPPATDDAARWSGWGTALKPAHEPIVVARKPLAGTVAGNVLAHGTGALNIDGCRVATSDNTGRTRTTALGVMNDDAWQPKAQQSEPHDAGRWPSNVVLDEYAAAELDRQSGDMRARGNTQPTVRTSAIWGNAGPSIGPTDSGDTGGASRFFPTFRYQAKAPTKERPKVDGVAHPTVKPLALMRWLVRLVTPPGGLVLDPFAGSGTTAEAAILEGFRATIIEKEQSHLPLIFARLSRCVVPESFPMPSLDDL
jgi:site-specific DNA-methyltransferase (adenine-specific)